MPAWAMGWAGVMLLVWALRTGLVFAGIVLWSWWMGFVAYGIFRSWVPAWYVVPLLIAGPLLVWMLREAHLEHRHRVRYARSHP
jgi:hypothetical protein